MDSPSIVEDLASEPLFAACKLIAASANDALLPRSGVRGFPHYGALMEWNNRFGADMLALLRDNTREFDGRRLKEGGAGWLCWRCLRPPCMFSCMRVIQTAHGMSVCSLLFHHLPRAHVFACCLAHPPFPPVFPRFSLCHITTAGMLSAFATRMMGSQDVFAARWDGGLPGGLATGRRPAFGVNALEPPLAGDLLSVAGEGSDPGRAEIVARSLLLAMLVAQVGLFVSSVRLEAVLSVRLSRRECV